MNKTNMTNYPRGRFAYKIFVKEQDDGENAEETQKAETVSPADQLTGESAKEFYESVISMKPSVSHVKSKNMSTPKKEECPINRIQFRSQDLLRLSQNNEADAINHLLKDSSIPVDSVDDFGWTALMCAACSGAQEAVEILLANGADPNHCDKFGNNALKLAKRNKFQNIVDILNNLSSKKFVSQSTRKMKNKRNKQLFCEKCKTTFEADGKDHESSILHLLSSNSFKHKVFYKIPESNKGFQMLLKNGWNREKGLGVWESGIQFPIKAIRKNDRIGIGGSVFGKEITKKKIHGVEKHESNNTEKSRLEKNKHFERNFKLQFW